MIGGVVVSGAVVGVVGTNVVVARAVVVAKVETADNENQ